MTCPTSALVHCDLLLLVYLLIPILCPVYIHLLLWLSQSRHLPLFLLYLYYSLGIDTRLADEFVPLELFLPQNIEEHPLLVCWT